MNVFLNNINSEQQLPLKVIAVGECEDQQIVERINGYPAYHCMLCKSGTGHLLVDGCHYEIDEDTFFLLKPNQPHKYYPEDAGWHTSWVVFEGETASQILEQLKLADNQPRKFPKSSSINLIFNMILSYASNGGISSIYRCSAQLYALLVDLSYTAYNNNMISRSIITERIEKVIRYIELNWKKNMGLNEMSSLIDVTPQYLCRLFKDFLGMTPYEYLISYRLQKSKEIMSDKTLFINEVGSCAGFNDASYFCSVFKKYEGITPLQFRKIYY